MKNSYLNDEFFSRLETLSIGLPTDLGGFFGGTHRTNTFGQTVEFADYREYMLGDDIRRIDWNLYSRFEKHYLKLFTDERQMHTQIFLDCSASMAKESEEKKNYAVALMGALGYLSIHNMDKLSFKLIKGNFAEDKNGTIVGKRNFFKAISELDNVEFDDECDLETAIMNTPNLGSADGLTIIISDFFTNSNWKKAVDLLRSKKRQVLLLQVLTRSEATPAYTGRVNLIDMESIALEDTKNMKLKITQAMIEAYDRAMTDLVNGIKSFCVSRGASYCKVITDTPIERVIFGDLLRTGIII